MRKNYPSDINREKLKNSDQLVYVTKYCSAVYDGKSPSQWMKNYGLFTDMQEKLIAPETGTIDLAQFTSVTDNN